MAVVDPLSEHALRGSVASRFREVASRSPDKPAIHERTSTTTYGELLARSDAVANLVANAVPSDTPVALLLDQGADFVAGMFGCLAAGAPYVPLDTAYPTARIQQMLSVARPPLLLASEGTWAAADQLRAADRRVVAIDRLPLSTGAQTLRSEASSAAYILFTSGSTGAPKGVVDSHRNILHNALRHTRSFRITADDRQTLLYTCGVYGGARDIFSALLNGASLHHYDVRVDGYAAIDAWLQEHRITLYCSVASLFRYLGRHLSGARDLSAVRVVKLGGEATRREHVDLFRRLFPIGSTLYTGLASTETGTVCQYPIRHDTPIAGDIMPLGSPAYGMEVRVVDPSGREVGEGEVGEILVLSDHLALGYYGDAEATEAKFVSLGGLRAYRTGDLACRDPEGVLLHRGRGDRQVKIRGNRVALPDVESAVRAQSGVDEAVVVARPDRDGEDVLVAYVVPVGSMAISASEVRRGLAAVLPAFMIPGAILVCPALPRTVNGKIDLAALPEPPESESTPVTGDLPAIERSMIEFWQTCLGTRRVGLDDDFFALGGHSLQALSFIEHIARQLGVRIAPSDLLPACTIRRAMALVAKAARAERGGAPAAREEVASRRLVSFSELAFLPQQGGPDNPTEADAVIGLVVRAVRFTGRLEQRHLARALRELVARHENLRTVYGRSGDEWVADVRPDADEVGVEVVSFDQPTEEGRLAIIQHEAAAARERPFSLRQVPHLRAKLLQLGRDDHALVLTAPHVVADGASFGIIEMELVELYEAPSARADSPLPRPGGRYRDFAAQERARFSEPLSRSEVDQLVAVARVPGPELPLLPGAAPERAPRQQAKLPVEGMGGLLASLEAASRREMATTQMGLLAAFAALVRRYAAADALQILMPWANRAREFDDVVGCFMNLVACRIDTAGHPSFRQLLHRARAAAIESYSAASVPIVVRSRTLAEAGLAAQGHLRLGLNVARPRPALLRGPGLSAWTVPLEAGSINPIALTLMVDGSRVHLKYRPDLLAHELVAQMADELPALVSRCLDRPDEAL